VRCTSLVEAGLFVLEGALCRRQRTRNPAAGVPSRSHRRPGRPKAFPPTPERETRLTEGLGGVVLALEPFPNPDFGGFVVGQANVLALAGRIGEATLVCARAMKLESGLSIRSVRELGYAPVIEAKLVQAQRLLGVPEN